MTQRKIPARDLIVQVSDGAGTPVWLAINGLKSMTVKPSENEQTADTTTVDSDGEYEELVMQRGASLTLEGLMLKDHLTGVQDPGQARCEELAAGIGYASRGHLRFRHPVDTEWRVWEATFRAGDQGGDNNAITSWAVTAVRCGPSTTVAVA